MIPWRREWESTPVFLPGKSYGQRSLVGYNPWGCKESDRVTNTHVGPKALDLWILLQILLIRGPRNWTSQSFGYSSLTHPWIAAPSFHFLGSWAQEIHVLSCCMVPIKYPHLMPNHSHWDLLLGHIAFFHPPLLSPGPVRSLCWGDVLAWNGRIRLESYSNFQIAPKMKECMNAWFPPVPSTKCTH